MTPPPPQSHSSGVSALSAPCRAGQSGVSHRLHCPVAWVRSLSLPLKHHLGKVSSLPCASVPSTVKQGHSVTHPTHISRAAGESSSGSHLTGTKQGNTKTSKSLGKCPDQCVSVGWVSSCTAKGGVSIPGQGTCPGCGFKSPVRATDVSLLSMFSPSLSPSLPLSLKLNKISFF